MDVKEEYKKWSESAYYWNFYRTKIERIYGPITQAILTSAGIKQNDVVLDIGGGAGEPSLTIQQTTDATLVFTDPTSAMTFFTRAEANKRNLRKMAFCCCSGDHLPFFEHTFDRIVSRLSMMFIPDTSQAAREMLRVSKENARITMAVWNNAESNPMHCVPMDALKPYITIQPDPPDAPGAFRFAEPGKLANVFKRAGARQVEERVIDFEISAIESIDEFWTIRSEMSESLRDKMSRLQDSRREEAIAAVKSAVQPYYINGRMRFPSSVRLVTVTV
jgi:ubiquinone/menaquinone biosynthesis C-methylase UbiE